MNFKSKPVSVDASRKRVYEFLADFNNFEKLMPDKVTNWQSDKESCSFTIEGMADMNLRYAAKEPFHTIKVEPVGKTPVQFDLTVDLQEDAMNEQKTDVVVEIYAKLNPMMAMIAKRPLANLADVIGEKLNGVFR